MKKWYQSKTIWFGIATMLSAALSALSDGGSMQEVIIAAVGAANVYLRTKTNQSVLRGKDE